MNVWKDSQLLTRNMATPPAAAASMAQAINNVAKMNATANAAVAAVANNAAKVATATATAPNAGMMGGRRKSRRNNKNTRVSYPAQAVRKTKGRRRKARKTHGRRRH